MRNLPDGETGPDAAGRGPRGVSRPLQGVRVSRSNGSHRCRPVWNSVRAEAVAAPVSSPRAQRATRAEVGLRSERGPILLAVMLSIGLVAIDATILATAVPSVVADLGGFTSFPWMFSIYLLAQAVSVPVYGKLADVYGRKPLMLLGVGLFVLGSLLCGVAWSMPALIVFRLVQGLGAGAIAPVGMTDPGRHLQPAGAGDCA